MELASTAAAATTGCSSKPKKRVLHGSGSGKVAIKKPTTKKGTQSVKETSDSAEPLNPVLVNVVAKNLMGYLDVNELLKARSVCKIWNFEAVKALQTRSYTVNFKNCNAISKFVQITRKLDRLPFTKFTLNNRLTSRVKTNFLNFGSQIKTLDIRIKRKIYGSRNAISLLNIHSVLSTTPNLENLSLHGINISGGIPFVAESADAVLYKLRRIEFKSSFHRYADVEFSLRATVLDAALKRFFHVAPNLEILDVDVPHNSGQPVDILLKVISSLRTLKTLNIEHELAHPEIGFLFDAKFELESLKIVELVYRANDTQLPNLLAEQAKTLKKLHYAVHHSPVNTEPEACRLAGSGNIVLPPMPNLKHLTINWQNELHFAKFNRQEFPKLVRLDLIDVNPQCLTNVFTRMTFLEHLTINCLPASEERNADITSALCGLPNLRYTVSAIQRLKSRGINAAEVSRFEELTLLSAEPSLREMTKLKSLSIYVKLNPQHDGPIDDSTVYFTLLKMQRLQHLIISNRVISSPVRADLEEYHGHVVAV